MYKSVSLKYKQLSLPKKSAIWFTMANFLNLGISVLSTPIFTRLLSESEYGSVSVYNTWTSILSVFITLNLAYGIYEILLVDYENDRDNMTSALITVTIILTLGAMSILFIWPNVISNIVGIRKELLFLMFPEILCNAIVTFWMTKNRFIYNYKSCIMISVIISISRVLLSMSLVIVFRDNGDFWRILGNALSYYMIGLLLGISMLIKGNKYFNIKYWKIAISFNIVMIPHYLSGILLSSSDRIMISKLVGDDKAGIYSLAYTCASLISILFTSINSVFTPYIYKSLRSKNYVRLKEITNKLIFMSIVFALLLMLIAPELISFFAPENYKEGIKLIPPITAGVYMTFLYSLFSSVEFYYKKNKFITFATIIGAIINIILNLISIPIIGYQAAAYTTLIGYIIMIIFHYIFYRKICNEEIYDIRYMIKSIFIFLGNMFIIMLIYPYFIVRVLIVFCLILILVKKLILVEKINFLLVYKSSKK